MNITKKIGWIALLSIICNVVIAQSPNWAEPDPSNYNFSANIVSIISYNDELINSDQDSIAILIDDEVHGLGDAVEIAPGEYRYFITVYSNEPTDTMDIVVYHAATDTIYTTARPLVFGVQNIYGSVDDPMHYKVYEDNDAPIYITAIDELKTLEGFVFDDVNLEDYLVQVDDQDVIWTYDENPNLDVSITDGILSVMGAEGFTGMTSLTVTATEVALTLSAGLQSRASSNSDSENNHATVNIDYNVVAAYAPPAWDFILSQEIVKGETFDPIALHDYEYQHAQPTIFYDYAPVVQESFLPVAQPTWIFDDNMETSMTMVLAVNYTPKYTFDHTDDVLAAYIGEELRGVATRDADSGLYFLTVSGTSSETEKMTLEFYSGTKKELLTYKDKFDYIPHEVVGAPDDPYAIDMAPIIPVVTETAVINGIEISPVMVADTSFVGQVFFDFIAMDPTFPMYLRDTTRTSFCIAPDDAVVGVILSQVDVTDENCVDASDGVLEVVAYCIDCIGSLKYSLDGINYQSSPFFTGLDGGDYLVYVRDSAFQYCQKVLGATIKQGFDDYPLLLDPSISSETWSDGYQIHGSDISADDNFGTAVDIFNRYAIVGAPYNDDVADNNGAAYIYHRENGVLVEQQKLVASDAQANASFGNAVSLTENVAVVGAKSTDGVEANEGAVYIYSRVEEEWSEINKLTASDASAENYFGSAVDIFNKNIAVGAVDPLGDNAGIVYTYVQNGDEWDEQIISPTELMAEDQFGYDVRLTEEWLVIGAPGIDGDQSNSGAVYIYQNVNGAWEFNQILTQDVEELGAGFGHSVAIYENRIAVGAPIDGGNDSSTGKVYLFEYEADTWIQKDVVKPDDTLEKDQFGYDVDISDTRLIASKHGLNLTEGVSGSCYVFDIETEVISQIDKITTESLDDMFGNALALSNSNLIVSAQEDNEIASNAGGIYVTSQKTKLNDIIEACELNSVDAPTATGNCGGLFVGVTNTIFPLSEQGDTTVTWTFVDGEGEVHMFNQFISVQDIELPTIECVEDISFELDETGSITLNSAEIVTLAEDNCGIKSITLSQDVYGCTDVGISSLIATVEDNNLNTVQCKVDIEIIPIETLVTTLGDSGEGSLRNIINAGCPSDTIKFDPVLDGSSVSLDSEIEINRIVIIEGLPDIDIDANSSSRIFNILPDAILDLHSLHLINGESATDGGAILNNGVLWLNNIIFENNTENNIPKALTNFGDVILKEGSVIEIK